MDTWNEIKSIIRNNYTIAEEMPGHIKLIFRYPNRQNKLFL